jgi:hypothetical protein
MEENKILLKLELQDQKSDAILGKLDEHGKKLEQHDQQFVKIDGHFEAIDKKLEQHDQQFAKIDEHFVAVDKHLEHHDKQFEAIVGKLIEHDEKLDNMVTKQEFHELREEILQGQDEIITIVKRLDQERVSTIGRIDRIEDRVEQTEKEVGIQRADLNKVKVQLNIP